MILLPIYLKNNLGRNRGIEKNKSIDIKQKLNIEYAEQEQYDLRAISLISNYLENK